MNAGEARRAAREALAPDPGAALDADRIVSHVLGASRASLHAHPERELSRAEIEKVMELSDRRAAGEPLAYLFGSSFFCGLELIVDRRVLIPRPETETLVQLARDHLAASGSDLLADWCTGSGCVALALLAEDPDLRSYAVDASADALDAAMENARRLGLASRMTPLLCAEPSRAEIPRRSLSLITADPPYIRTDEIDGLDREVRDHEPRLALDGGADGLDVARALLDAAPQLLAPRGRIIFELAGPEQIELLASSAHGTSLALTARDHRGIERFAAFDAPG